MNRQRSSVRSRGSSSTTASNPREKVKDCCRKLVAFMCTQVGVGGLIVGYAIVGAVTFMSIETQEPYEIMQHVESLRRNCAAELWDITEQHNLFNASIWHYNADMALKRYQDEFTMSVKKGYDGRTPEQVWSFPAALMFCLSVFTMIGYGNMLPRTQWGKGATVIYATFGIPLYILYFMNMGKVLASVFKWLYTWFHECSRDKDDDYNIENVEMQQRKRVIVPSTACLWVISFYIATGTIMFAEWEGWDYLDSAYFCVTSLCKIGIGDFVPGANILDSEGGKPTKLVINFVYMLLGMGIVAMCYILMREEVRVKMKEMKEDTKLCLEDLSSKFTRCFGGGGGGSGGKELQYYD